MVNKGLNHRAKSLLPNEKRAQLVTMMLMRVPMALRRLRRSRLRGRLIYECGVAHTVIETDPIDPLSIARRIPIALVNAPKWRLVLGNVLQRTLHRTLLILHAALLPLAI
jgi:hypothetical protein